ncbi:MAG: metallophosphoesterase [Actinobacteria bacterium]|nr:metallophosphoesterase [Actinomycetota bacterium]
MSLPPLRLGPGGLQVFAVEDTTAQLTWSALGRGEATFAAGGGLPRSVALDGGPGSVVLGGLPPGADFDVVVDAPALGRRARLRAHTLAALPGTVQARVATVSDVHIGTTAFGHRGTLVERPAPAVPHPERCTEAALAEAVEWGAEVIVVKGDLTDSGTLLQWQRAAAMLREVPVPVYVLPGNHDRSERRTIEPWDAGARLGLHVVHGVEVVDRPGLRLVLADTSVPGTSKGRLRERAEAIVDAARAAPRDASVLVAVHHHLHRLPMPMPWPPGVPGVEARPFLDALGAAHPRVLVTAGHTHRHRRRHQAGVAVTQVGATKDWPGVWAGYTAATGGLRQVVRRTGRADVLRWTDHTRRGAAGLWRWWSPGALDDRCFSIT